MSMGKIYQNDVGVEIRVATTVDFNTATVKQIKVRKPDLVEVTWTATLYNGDATHKTLSYTTLAADLDVLGEYEVQAYGEWTSASKHLGETFRFTVYQKFE
jgi:hypothetical protein